MKNKIMTVDLSKAFPIVTSVLALTISIYGIIYTKYKDLESDRLKMAYDYIEQNYEVNRAIQTFRCINKLIESKEPEGEGSEKNTIFAISPEEERETIEGIMLFSKKQIEETRTELLLTKHFYKVRINNHLIELAKKHPKEKIESAKFTCQNHI